MRSVSRAAVAGEELLGQRVRDAPLRRRGVLHLVQQQVVEPAVQLVQHPGGAGIDQQARRPSDQVVVVEQARRLLVRRIGAAAPARRASAARPRQPPRAAPAQASITSRIRVAFGEKASRQRSGMRVLHRLADEPTFGARLALLGQELVAPVLPVFAAIRRPPGRASPGSGLPAREHCFAPRRCTISAASRRSRSDCQLTALASDLRLAAGGHAERATLRRLQPLAQTERALQPGQVRAAAPRHAGRTGPPMRGRPASSSASRMRGELGPRQHGSRAPRSGRPRRRDRRPGGNAATAPPPAGSAAAATGRRRGSCRCACRPAGPAPWRTAHGRRVRVCLSRFDIERRAARGPALRRPA